MKPTVSYFDFRALAEPIRLALHLAEIDFEDIRVDLDEWAALKPKTPFGQIPIYQDDDVTLCQTMAIVYYICKKHNMIPSEPNDAAVCMMLVGCADDITSAFGKVYVAPDDQKEKIAEDLRVNVVPFELANLEKLVKLHGSKGHAFGNFLTIADVYVGMALEMLIHEGGLISPKTSPVPTNELCPALMEIYDATYGGAGVAEWVKTQRH